jgi:hypothetical protein
VLITGQQWEEDAWMAPSSRIDSRYSYAVQRQFVPSCGRHGWLAFRRQVPVQQLLLVLVQGAPKGTPQVPARDDPGAQQMLPGVVQVGTQTPVAGAHVVHGGQLLGAPPWQVPLLQV